MTNINDLKFINRNGVQAPVTMGVVGNKSETKKGLKFPMISFKPEDYAVTLDADGKPYVPAVTFLGASDLCDQLNTFYRRESLDAWLDCIDENTNLPDMDEWIKSMEDISAGTERLGNIQQQIEDYSTESTAIVLGPELSDGSKGATALGETDAEGHLTCEATKASERLLEVNRILRELKKKAAEISAKFAARAVTRKATKLAKAKAAAEAAAAEAKTA